MPGPCHGPRWGWGSLRRSLDTVVGWEGGIPRRLRRLDPRRIRRLGFDARHVPPKTHFSSPLLARLWCRCWLREVPCLDDPSTSSRNDKASVRWAIQSLPRYMGGPHTFAVARGMRIVSTQRTIEGGARSVRLAAGVRRSIKYTDLSMIDCSVDRRISFLLGVQRAGGRCAASRS